MKITKIAVVGAGTIGASWAALFLARGFDVVVSDPAPDCEPMVRTYVATAWPTLEALGQVVATADTQRLSFEPDLEQAVRDADFVQENAPEREQFKIDLFARIDAATRPEVLIASSSSGLMMSQIQVRCKNPERCVIGHPFNPPHLIPLVEVVGGKLTSEQTIEQAMAFYRELGKYPIRLHKELPGHVANRLQAALWREAIHLVMEGVASVEDVDAAVTQGPGLRWAVFGPSMTFHLGGGEGGLAHFMNHLSGPMQSWWDDLGAPQLTQEVQQRIIEGVKQAAAGTPLASHAAERDRRIVAMLQPQPKQK